MRPVAIFDMEVYSNYLLLMFKQVQNGEILWREAPFDLALLRLIVREHRLITFNGNGYDIPLLMLILKGATVAQVKAASDRIIIHNLKPWNFEREFDVSLNDKELDHVDLMEVAPLKGSLKLYGGRMHSRSIQDLPFEPGARIEDSQKGTIRDYCANDLQTTLDLYNALKVQLELRESMSTQYGIDLRSKSDAQIAEAVIRSEVEKLTGHRVEKPGKGPGDIFKYQVPGWMRFRTLDILKTIGDADFVVSAKGSVLMPSELEERKIEIGRGVYRMGIGGLHSSEQKACHKADQEFMILDYDVASYYPAILLGQGLFPRHIGKEFLDVYRNLVKTRLEAKAAGRKTEAESLKICVNGTFGKFGSKYSILYSPDMLVQITVTGQLALLMLIEALAGWGGIQVISANTDSVTVMCRRGWAGSVRTIIKEWETTTGFTTEEAELTALYSRDVNNYIAVKKDGEVKVKGVYGVGLPLQKNPTANICAKAVIDYLTLDASIRGTVRACDDIRQFVCVRKVTGGATWHGKEIGKVIRWYYAVDEEEAILYKLNGHLVPKTFSAKPAVALPDHMPEDLDYSWYVDEAYSMLEEIGGTI